MSQVKNLRAMFESKGENSPPDSRGRSPTGASTTSDGPRPLSKVRTSFVAIEKDGRIGLKRDQSHDSSASRSPLIGNDRESSLYPTRNKMSTQDDSLKASSAESIPEVPESALNVSIKSPDDKTTDSSAQAEEAKSGKTTASRSTAATASKTATKPASTKPAASKTEPAKRPVTKPVATTRATGAATAAKKPAPVKIGPSDTGFTKPKPKSPTKPVDLPSSLMAPTASSAHKGGASRRSISGNLPQSVSAPPASASSTASKPTKRQPPTAVKRSRPSLGLSPASKVSQESSSSSSKRQSQVDDGFLARMTRPTTASSSKTAEKGADKGADKGAPGTPARKTVPRPSNVTAEATKRTTKSPLSVRVRAGSATRTREGKEAITAKATNVVTSVAKAAALPVAVASAAVASTVASNPMTSKLAEKLATNEPKEETKEEAQAQHTADVSEPEPEMEEEAGKVDLPQDTLADVEEKHSTLAAQEAVTEPPVKDVVEAPAMEEPAAEESAPEESESESVPLDEAALEAAQVETAEEAIIISGRVDTKHPSESIAAVDESTEGEGLVAEESEEL